MYCFDGKYKCIGRFEKAEGKEGYSTNRSEFLSIFGNMIEGKRSEILLNLCIRDYLPEAYLLFFPVQLRTLQVAD
jgi:hypothetical protein